MEEWAQAVRAKDANGVLRHYAPDVVTFDLAPPLKMYLPTPDSHSSCRRQPLKDTLLGCSAAFPSAIWRSSCVQPEDGFCLFRGLRVRSTVLLSLG